MKDVNPLDRLEPDEKEIAIASIRYWIMHDIYMQQRSIQSDETGLIIRNFKKHYPLPLVEIMVKFAWGGIGAEFLNQYGIEPNLLY
jgi:hypothetical protein